MWQGLKNGQFQPKLVVSLVLTRVDYCNSILTGLLLSQLNRLQAVMNAAARLILLARRCDHITLLLEHLHWLHDPQRIEYKLCVLVYRCLYDMVPYLANSIQRVSDVTTAFGGNIATDRTCHQHSATERSLSPLLAPGIL